MIGSAMLVLALAGASAAEADERLCQRVLALANDGALEGAFAVAGPANDVDPALAARWQEAGYAGVAGVAGAYDIARADGRALRLYSIDGGGTCHSYDLAFADGTSISFDPLVEDDETFGLDTVPMLIDGTSVALAWYGDRWTLSPLALVRLEPGAAVPLCRFATTGDVRRVRVGDGSDDRVCAAVRNGSTEPVEWSPVEDRSEVPEALGGVEELASAAPDWFGDGHPRATWLIGDESGAGCGTTYRWLALAGTDAGPPVIDTTSAAGRALYPRVEHERVANGPWLLDGVFAFAGRAWFAGQPQWGATKRGDYAVYRVDPDGVHAQCQYRRLPQFRIERRAF